MRKHIIILCFFITVVTLNILFLLSCTNARESGEWVHHGDSYVGTSETINGIEWNVQWAVYRYYEHRSRMYDAARGYRFITSNISATYKEIDQHSNYYRQQAAQLGSNTYVTHEYSFNGYLSRDELSTGANWYTIEACILIYAHSSRGEVYSNRTIRYEELLSFTPPASATPFDN